MNAKRLIREEEKQPFQRCLYLILKIGDYGTLHGKRDSADVIKLGILRWTKS